MVRFTSSLLLFAVFATAPLAGLAAPITVPSGLIPGDQYRLVFVTSTTRDATSSDIDDYNDFVQSAADSVPELFALGSAWKAIASTASVDAIDNTETRPTDVSVPIYLLDDSLFTSAYIAMWGGILERPLEVQEDGDPATDPPPRVWTGTQRGGRRTRDPLGTVAPTVGDFRVTFPSWIDRNLNAQFVAYRLYAISGVLTVIPEPGTMSAALVALSATTVVGRRTRRRGQRE